MRCPQAPQTTGVLGMLHTIPLEYKGVGLVWLGIWIRGEPEGSCHGAELLH